MSDPINAPVARTAEGEELVNTLVVSREVVKIRFQIAPGTDANLGIADVDYEVHSGGAVIKSDKTNADGEIEVPLQPLLTGAAIVKIFDTDYSLTLHAGLEGIRTRKGQQKRYDILGYMTGYQLTPIASAVADDGSDGPRTQQSIMNVQADSNISIDGGVGNQTRTQLTTKTGE